jgi:hypothetical protein
MTAVIRILVKLETSIPVQTYEYYCTWIISLIHITACLLKSRTVKRAGTAVAREQLRKHARC